MATPLLQVSGLHAGYGRAEVLSGLGFELAHGQVVTVIGPNGAGKSTTLNALMGLLPARGRILFDGRDLAGTTLEERVMLGLALVPEKRELFGSMPVEDNLILGGFRPMKLRIPQWRSGLERVYALFPRLKERRAQLAGTLSGGERQMLALGRALMSSPRSDIQSDTNRNWQSRATGPSQRVMMSTHGAKRRLIRNSGSARPYCSTTELSCSAPMSRTSSCMALR